MVSTINNALSGLSKAVEKLDNAAESISKLGTTKDDADLVKDIVDIKAAKNAYKANLAVIKAQKEMDEETIDILV